MAEKLSIQTDERDELSNLEAQLAELEKKRDQKRFAVEANENFGKYDVTVPAEGEDTYATYMENRSKDGVAPDARGQLRNNGKFASVDDYFAGKEGEAHYYNRVIEEGASNEESFNDMSMIELAEKLGEYHDDRSMSGELMSILQEKVDEYAEKYGWNEEKKNAHMDKLLEISLRNTEKKETEIDSDSKKLLEIEAALKANPELADDPKIRAELEALRRELEPGKKPSTVGEGDKVVAGAPKTSEEDDDTDEELRKALEKDLAFPKLEDVPVDPEEVDTDKKLRAALDEEIDMPKIEQVPELGDEIDTRTPEEVLRETLNTGFAGRPAPETYYEEKVEQPAKRFSLAKRAHLRAATMFGEGRHKVGQKVGGVRERWKNTEKDKKRGLGVVALLGVVAAGYVAYRLNAHDQIRPKTHGGGSPLADQMKSDQQPKLNAAKHLDDALRTHEALTIDNGEGWLHQLQDMRIPQDEMAGLLEKISNSKDSGIRAWTYMMQNGDPGISRPGNIPPSVLESIEELRNQ